MNNNVDYKLMRLTSSKCSEYFEAMKIYTQSVEYIQKTSTNEIKYWIDHFKKWFCQYHLTHFIRTRIMQRERYDHSRAFFGLPEAVRRWRCRFFC